MAICILIAGRSIALRKRYSFAFVMARIECLFIPFGTILGVFTIRCPFARIGEGIILQCNWTSAELKLSLNARQQLTVRQS